MHVLTLFVDILASRHHKGDAAESDRKLLC